MTTAATIPADWTSVLPPVLAIALAIATRQVYLSLAAGVWLGCTILVGWNPLAGIARSIDEVVAVLQDAGNARVVLFTLVIGALIATLEASGGVRGFVRRLDELRLVNSPRRAGLLVWIIGIIVFIESNITILVCGAVGRPLFDRFRLSRERLAYLIDSTSAPVCMLIPLNAWGALVLGILGNVGLERPLPALVASIPLNFYALAALLLAGITSIYQMDIGPMRRAEQRTQGGSVLWPGATPLVDPDVLAPPPNQRIPPRARNMLVPIVAMVLMMPLALYLTGDRQIEGVRRILSGSGSTSVLWSVLFALAVAWIMLLMQRAYRVDELVRLGIKGAGGLVSLALILLLALSLAAVANKLGTGKYVADVTVRTVPPVVFLPLVFVVAAVIGFCTGTSWGTFALMLPIAVPVALSANLPVAPFVAASLSGGVFGDHASPISDTTIIASMAAATDHIDHVRTQLPYALIAAGIAAIAFAITGALI